MRRIVLVLAAQPNMPLVITAAISNVTGKEISRF